MTPAMTSDLIARFEAATEGSREIDARIHFAVMPNPDEIIVNGRTSRDCIAWSEERGDWNGTARVMEAPHYTTSIDAKLPDEDIVRVEKMHDSNGPIWIAEAAKYGCLVVEGRGRTEALARRIAALRAREIQEDS